MTASNMVLLLWPPLEMMERIWEKLVMMLCLLKLPVPLQLVLVIFRIE